MECQNQCFLSDPEKGQVHWNPAFDIKIPIHCCKCYHGEQNSKQTGPIHPPLSLRHTIQDVSKAIQMNGAGKVILGVKRDSAKIKIKISPVQAQNGTYQIGAWLREDTEGIGTLTFVTEENEFAALGHGITDADTELLIRLQNGGLYPAGIDHVVKGKNGTPGQLAGFVQLGTENKLGDIRN